MGQYLVEYKHIEETTYADWIEADSEEDALELVEMGEVNFENEIDVVGVEITDATIEDKEEE